jgi:hypothetical protein
MQSCAATGYKLGGKITRIFLQRTSQVAEKEALADPPVEIVLMYRSQPDWNGMFSCLNGSCAIG